MSAAGEAVHTAHGGATWTEVFHLPGGRGFAWKLFPAPDDPLFAPLKTEDGVLRVARTDDRGDSWTVQVVDATGRERPGVQAVGFTDRDHGWVAGFFRGFYETADGGDTWTRHKTPDRSVNRFVLRDGRLLTASRRGVLALSADE